MITIFKSLCDQSDEEVLSIIDELLLPENLPLLSNQEKTVFIFLKDSVKSSQCTPSESYFLGHFPEYRIPFEGVKTYQSKDLYIHLNNLLAKRRNQHVSMEMLGIAGEVTAGGLTTDHMEMLGQLVVEEEAVEEGTDNASFEERYLARLTQPKGLKTFIKEVDDYVKGLPYGFVMTIAGYVGQYKSLLATNIAYNNTKKLGYHIAYISLEVTKDEMMYNLLCRHSFEPQFDKYPVIPHGRIRDLELTPEEREYLFRVVGEDYASTKGKEGTLVLLDESSFPNLSFSSIRRRLEKVDDELFEATGRGLDAVIVDHIGLLKYAGQSNRNTSTGEVINSYVSFFRQLSLKFRRDKETKEYRKIATILLAQINRDGYSKACKKRGAYTLLALAEANELERSSQIVLTTFTTEEMKMSKEATMQVLKNRNGRTAEEPMSVFVDPEIYVAGEEVEGRTDMVTIDDFLSVFEGCDISSAF
jgi:replicative DNA helicase